MSVEQIIARHEIAWRANTKRLVRLALAEIAKNTGVSRAWMNRSYAQRQRFARLREIKGESK